MKAKKILSVLLAVCVMAFIFSGCATTAAADPSATGGMASSLVMMAALFAVMYFLMIRPEKKRKKEAEETRASIKNGHKVTTIGGIIGVVVDVKEETFVMETSADRVRIEFQKWAISTNDTAVEEAKAEAKRREEEKAKAKAMKKASKEKK